MATMNVSLPDQMKIWVEQQGQGGRYSNSSDYIRDLIRQDQDRAAKVRKMQELVTEGISSGISKQSMADIREHARNLCKSTEPPLIIRIRHSREDWLRDPV